MPGPPSWPNPDAWETFSLPQPGNGWISSVAIAHDGKLGVYGGSIGGSFIPIADDVTLIRFEISPEMGKDLKPSVFALPGVSLRNFASLAWSKHGLAFGSRSTLGVADPMTGKNTRLHQLPIPSDRKNLTTFPLHSSVVWAPGGDCVAATIEHPDDAAELVTWNAAGARAASKRHKTKPSEKAAAWTDAGILLVWSSGATPARASWIDHESGALKDAEAPPADAQAFSWVSGGWLTIDTLGTVMHRVPGEPPVQITTVEPKLEITGIEKRRWLRVLASDNGKALIVEESLVAPKKDLRHMHVLTPRGP